ncbi:molybdopterin molybdotransferase MoeA [Acinetobacter sp. ANC 4173]|uniref:molybdopterin molybdotransferase MoeA n=1 Tax=Acinetobacter sp. ANC 4173 TaxID=2529837 RepID=UPI00103C1BA8|nr:molybdopterin molybdotransferase MoeA [Acinetobacter sp. ANC 4173]TCB79126.1 molybdopterin molybdenumtransferase MoeA [Acinetobacter sp. ANC 4173]
MSGCGAEKGLIGVDQALATIVDRVHALASESIPLQQALNRYLAEAIYSEIDLPLFSQSAVDGYAICSTEPILENSKFELVGEIRAGQDTNVTLNHGQALRIFTGAKIPEGTTTVARQEIVTPLNSIEIQINIALDTHADIRDVGEELSQGQLLANQRQHLSVGAIAALAMAGVQQVKVYQFPKVAVVITGDEVAKTLDDFTSGKIFDANAPLIQAWFEQQQQNVNIYHVEDTELALQQLIQQLKQECDVILTTGGVSVGDYDFVRPVALEQGFQQIFWKVKQKPGKPMLFAEYQRTSGDACYLLGLPGNPAAVFVGMQIYTATLLHALQGQTKLPNWFSATLKQSIKSDSRERFLRMFAHFEQGQLWVENLSKQQSHMLSNLMHANCLIRIPENQVLSAGSTVQGLFL